MVLYFLKSKSTVSNINRHSYTRVSWGQVMVSSPYLKCFKILHLSWQDVHMVSELPDWRAIALSLPLSISSLGFFTHNLTASDLHYQSFFVNIASSILKFSVQIIILSNLSPFQLKKKKDIFSQNHNQF